MSKSEVFQNLDEVILYFQNQYQKTGNKFIKITIPGAPIQDIRDLETILGVSFPKSLKNVLQNVIWGEANFRNLIFFDLDKLQVINAPDELWGWPGVKQTGYWEVGGSDGYFIFVKADSGVVYVREVATDELVKYADDFEQFVCIVASLLAQAQEWPDPEEDEEYVVAAVKEFLNRNKITFGWKFWRDIVMWWA